MNRLLCPYFLLIFNKRIILFCAVAHYFVTVNFRPISAFSCNSRTTCEKVFCFLFWDKPEQGTTTLLKAHLRTNHSVNFAKDWLDHSFLFPGLVWSSLVWSGKGFYFGYDHLGAVNNHFPVYSAISAW